MRFALGFIRKLLLLLLLALAVAVFGAYQYFSEWLEQPLPLPEGGLSYELAPGRALSHVVWDLYRQDLITHPRILLTYARFTDQSHVLAGDYELGVGMSPRQLLDMLGSGAVIRYTVTLVEGRTFADWVATLARESRLGIRLAELDTEAQLAALDLPIEHPEGWFFPDTYQYTSGDTDIDILRRAYAKMTQTLDQLWAERAENLPYESPYEALVMASIVERETGAPWERRKIAGVFVRRLQANMRLQTDPTVIYGMGASYQGRITRADLRKATAYNTYTTHGLPPTPIAMPGREAIYAALHPLPGSALYFVAKGDGTHVFSDTLDAHNNAVRQYQLNRRSDYRSSPPLQQVPESGSEQ
ncbi:MAG TPA: endolytic transglycosylase MltG [Cellvibrionaceae bacterium]